MLTVYFDGLCEPTSPGGVATYGYVVCMNGKKLKDEWAFVADGRGTSSNLAEYAGLAAALRWLLTNGYKEQEVEVRGDSRQVVAQMNANWRARRSLYVPKHEEMRKLREEFREITFRWVPREENTEADRLSRRAYEDYCIRKGREVVYHKS